MKFLMAYYASCTHQLKFLSTPLELGAYCSTQDLFMRKIEILYGTGFIAPSKKMNLALAVVRKSKEPPPYLSNSQ